MVENISMQPQIRAAVIAALNVWAEQTTLAPFVECEALADGLKTENPNLRTEVRYDIVNKSKEKKKRIFFLLCSLLTDIIQKQIYLCL